jgi:hypothetical protein
MLFINVLLMLDIHFWFCTSLVWYLPPLLLCRCGRSFKLQPQVQVYSSLFLRSSFFKVYFYFLSVVCLYFLGFLLLYIFYMLIMLVVCLCAGLAFHISAIFSQIIIFSKLQTFCMMERRSKLFVIINACNFWDLIFIAWILNLNRTHILAKRRFFYFHFFTLCNFLVENVVRWKWKYYWGKVC